MNPKHFFSARLCAEASVVKAYGCTSLAGLTGQAKAGRAGRADEALVRQHRHRHSQYIEHTEQCHFSCGISNVVGPKKQDFFTKNQHNQRILLYFVNAMIHSFCQNLTF